MRRHWTQGRYLVLDTETTGLIPETDRVVELAAHSVDLATGTVTSVFDQLINPGRPIPPEASAIHHLVDRDVAGALSMEQVWADFAPLLAQHDAVVAHHARFDRACLPPTTPPGSARCASPGTSGRKRRSTRTRSCATGWAWRSMLPIPTGLSMTPESPLRCSRLSPRCWPAPCR